MKPRFPVSTLCLLVAVVALTLSVFLLTARHNAQLAEQVDRHNAQLVEQAERFNAQLAEQAARCNAELAEQAARSNAELIARDTEARKARGQAPEEIPEATPEP